MSHRRGRARVLTPEEMREYLAIPIYYILIGKAQPAFPHSATPAPSEFVQIIRVREIPPDHVTSFPAFVNWCQWNEVIAPLLEDCRWANWLGSTGGCFGDTNIIQDSAAALYACNRGLLNEYIRLVGEALYLQASDVRC